MPTPSTSPDNPTRSLIRLLISLTVPPLVSALCFGLIAALQDAREGKWLDFPGYSLSVLVYSILLCAIPALIAFALSEILWRYGRSGWRDLRHYLGLGAALGVLSGIGFTVFLGGRGYFDADWKTPLAASLLIGIGALAGGLTALIAYKWRR